MPHHRYNQIRQTFNGLSIAVLSLLILSGCEEDRQIVEQRVFKEFTRLVCTNTDPDMAQNVISYAHFILKYNEKSGHITAAQLIGSSSYQTEEPPYVVWSYSIDEVYKGTDYLNFHLKLGDSERDGTMFHLDRSDLTMRVSPPAMMSPLYFQCEKMNDDQFQRFLKDRRARLEEIESKNKI